MMDIKNLFAKKHQFKALSLAIVFFIAVKTACADGPLPPTGLMTDLLEWTDRVWIDGLASQMTLSELGNAIERTQVAEIRSLKPTFSWIVNDLRNNVLQTAFQFELSKTLSFDEELVWESGKVESRQSSSVSFEFPPLEPKTIYYWRVRTWNNGDESPWSEPKGFLTAERLWDNTETDYPQTSFDGPTSRYPVVLDVEHPEVSENGNCFFDFKRDAFAYLTLTISNPGELGKRFAPNMNSIATVRLGERVCEGNIDRHPAGSTRFREYNINLLPGTHSYRIKNIPDKRNASGEAVKVPGYIGELLPFRYAEIEFSSPDIQIIDITRYAAHYPFGGNASYFHSDSDILNQIWDLCRYSMKATSFAGIFVDGDRERIPYEGDALLNQLGYYAVDREYSLARLTQDYLISRPTWPTEWILQSVCMAWYDWLWTGDKNLLARRYEDLKAKTLLALAGSDGLISTTGEQPREFLDSIHFTGNRIRDIVDWPHKGLAGNENAESGETDGFVFTDKNVVVNSYHYFALSALLQFAVLLEKDDDVKRLNEQIKVFKTSFYKTFWNEEKHIFRDGSDTDHASLHGNMFPLAFGLVAEEDRKSVVDFIKSRGMKCSVYGSQFFLDALYEGNESEEGLLKLTDTGTRSWFNMIRIGSTISLEAWDDIYKPNQDWNHAWGAAPANIIPRRIAGIEPTSPGFSTMRIKPQTASLKKVVSLVPTIRGNVSVSIEKKENSFHLEIITPANTVSEIWLPRGNSDQTVMFDGAVSDCITKEDFYIIKDVGSGKHRFDMNTADKSL